MPLPHATVGKNSIVLRGYETPQEAYEALGSGEVNIVGMNLTSECNYRCPYCFVGAANLRTGADEMTTEQKLSALEQARQCGARVLIICGRGEPFKDIAIWQVIEKASKLGMWTIIYTNGSLISGQHMANLCHANVSLMVKVDSLDPTVYEAVIGHKPPHDDLRAWLRTLKEALPSEHNLVQNRILARLGVNAVLSRANAASMTALSDFCHQEGILFSCRVVQRTGDAVQNWEQLVGSEQAHLNKIAKECSMRTVSSQAPDGCCSIYRYGVTIENNGEIYVCPNSRAYQKSIGNVCNESLATLLKRRAKMYPTDHRPGYCWVRARSGQTAVAS
jgi:MoaA/NifB/PqqE/SkfB family radical SAM enzyme